MNIKQVRSFLIWVVLVLTLAVTLGVRFVHLGQIPWGVYWDEVAMMVDIKAILATGKDMHGLPWHQLIYPSYGDYKAPVYLLIAMLPSKFFGVSAFSLRLVSAVIGSLTIAVTGLISWQLASLSGAKLSQRDKVWLVLASMLAVGLSPWGMMFSRVAFEAFLAQFFLALAVWFLLLFNPAKKTYWWYLGLALFVGELSIYTYYSNRYVWPLVLVVVLIVKFWLDTNLKLKTMPIGRQAQNAKLKSSKSLWLKFFSLVSLSLLATYLLVLPLKHSAYYNASQQFRFSTDSVMTHKVNQVLTSNLYRQLAGDTWLDRLVFHRFLFLFNDLAKNLSANLSLNTLFLTGDHNLRHGTGMFGLFLVSFLPFFAIGLYQLARNNRLALIILVSWWLVALLPASVPNEVPHALRALNALVPLSLIIGWGLGFCFIWLAKKQRQWQTQLPSLFLMFILLFNFYVFVDYYFSHYPSASAKDWQAGYKELTKQIFRFKKDKEPVVILAPDDRFYLWLMAYGPFSGSEFANWSEKNFKKTDFDNLFFTQSKAKLDELVQSKKPFLLAGEVDKVYHTIGQHHQLKPVLCFPTKIAKEGKMESLVCKVKF